ncbi:MAG: DUF58 domain-containing protein [Proteobacteria bacterium]|nr:DUF58 domain-containing protein [Pseudomonadota bacterium]
MGWIVTLTDFLKKLKKIEFGTRMKTREAISGTYHSAFKGRGMTFSECKAYEEGDDVRYIDWHASARQQGVFVKQFIEERELSVCIVLDLSRPMRFGSVGMTKAEKAIEAMAVIAFSALNNNDKVGLLLLNEVGIKYIPQLKGKANVVRLLVEALKFSPEPSPSGLSSALLKAATLMKRRSLMFVISDFLSEDFSQSLRQASHHHEVIPVVISDPLERDMPNLGLAVLEDARSGGMVLTDTAKADFATRYRERFDARMQSLRDLFHHAGLTFVRLSTLDDALHPIARAFDRRAAHV